MANRTLTEMTYIDGAPAFGRCSACGRAFATPADTMADAEQAARDFYAAFASHECEREE
jgi:hypothetical protein